jgi:hypothetical protein
VGTLIPVLVLHDYHVSAVFQGSGTFFLASPERKKCEASKGTLDAGVMPRLERVVAFPRLKVSGFLQPHQHFRTPALVQVQYVRSSER